EDRAVLALRGNRAARELHRGKGRGPGHSVADGGRNHLRPARIGREALRRIGRLWNLRLGQSRRNAPRRRARGAPELHPERRAELRLFRRNALARDRDFRRRQAFGRRNVTVEPIPDQTCTGQPIAPKLTVKDGEKLLVEGADYSVRYADN